jgi:Caspase domain
MMRISAETDPDPQHWCLVFLCCQGVNFCSAALLAHRTNKDESSDEGFLDADSPPPSPMAKIPIKKDFLWAFSTCPGDVSFRHSTLGSFFIQALCKVQDQFLVFIYVFFVLYVAFTHCPKNR